MEKTNHYDVPDHTPDFRIPLDRVGIDHRKQMIRLRGQFTGDPDIVPTLCEVHLFSSLPPERKGLHLSRIGEVLFCAREKVFGSVTDYARELARELRRVQRSEETEITVEALYEKSDTTPVSGRHTTKIVPILAHVEHKKDVFHSRIGVVAPIITACPCTQLNFQAVAIPALEKRGFSLEQIKAIEQSIPFITHSQRASVKALMDEEGGIVKVDDLLQAIYSVTVETHDLLKRPDELVVVQQSHTRPQFVEDVVRVVAQELYSVYGGKVSPAARMTVRVEAEESIHSFNIVAQIDLSFAELGLALSG